MNTSSNQKRVHHVGSDKWQQMHSLLSPGNKNTSAMKIAKVAAMDKAISSLSVVDCYESYLQAKDTVRRKLVVATFKVLLAPPGSSYNPIEC